ncbi:MAG: hypothetical protein ACXVQ3_07545 [Gaiellaceae bacterium]
MAWRDDYPWLRLAFRQSGPSGKAASEEWRWRIEEDLKAPLDYQVRGDGTAAVWCGLTRYDFKHEPTPKDLLHGLDTAYRQELERRGWHYPDLNASAPAVRADSVTVGTRYGPAEISWAARDALVEEIRRRGSGDIVVRVFDAVGAARPVNLDRKGKIVVLDGIWGVAENAEGDLDPQLGALRDRLADEITEGTS